MRNQSHGTKLGKWWLRVDWQNLDEILVSEYFSINNSLKGYSRIGLNRLTGLT